VKVSAELILEIDKLLSNARKAEQGLKAVGDVGAESGARMHRGLVGGTRSLDMPVRMRGLDQLRSVTGRSQEHMAKFAAGLGGSLAALDGREGLDQLQRSVEATGDRLKVLAGVSVGAGAVLSGAIVASSVKSAAALQDIELQIARFSGGLGMAQKLMNQGAELGVKTPFETGTIYELQAGLMAAGDSANALMDDIKRLAAVAEDDQALTDLGTTFAQGITNKKFDTDKIKSFLDRRVNLLPALESVLGTNTDGVLNAITEGKVGLEEMRKALDQLRGPGGQFFGMMEARSKTLPGLWSTAASAADEIRVALGKASVAPLSQGLEVVINDLMPKAIARAAEWGQAMAGSASGLAAIMELIADKGMSNVMDSFGKSFQVGLDGFLQTMAKNPVSLAGEETSAQSRMDRQMRERSFYEGLMPMASALDHAFELWPDYDKPGILTNAVSSALSSVDQSIDKVFKDRMNIESRMNGIPSWADLVPDRKSASLETLMGAYQGNLRDASGNPLSVAKGAASPFETSKDDLMAMIEARIAQMGARYVNPADGVRPSVPVPEIPDLAPGDQDSGKEAATAATPISRTIYSLPGAMQSAVNRIAGRSTFDLVAEQVSEQKKALDGVRKVLERIEKKMTDEVILKTTGAEGSRFS